MKKMTIQLTSDQQKQIKDATGQDFTEVQLAVTVEGQLSEQELGKVQGGAQRPEKDDGTL